MTKQLATINIRGKEYVEVKERVKYFRANYSDHALVTSILSHEDGVILFRAEILSPEGRVLATGHALEKSGSNKINQTSYIENAETSAWGRALGNFGIGIDGAVASADEIKGAISEPAPKTISRKKNSIEIPARLLERLSSRLADIDNMDELNALFKDHEKDVKKYPSIRQLFTTKKNQVA